MEGGNGDALDQILIKHKCRFEREKFVASLLSGDEIKHATNTCREVSERELLEAWGELF